MTIRKSFELRNSDGETIGAYSREKATAISKSMIAKMQLEDAISFFLQEKYISAITLAGAADNIVVGLLKECGKRSNAELAWDDVTSIRRLTGLALLERIDRKEFFNLINKTRNRLKHHDAGKDADELELFPIDEAYEAIVRALGNASHLNIAPRNKLQFENNTIERFFL